MVHLYALVVLKTNTASKPVVLASHIDSGNSWASWLYADTLKEFAFFFSKLLCEKTPAGTRQQIEKDEQVGYVHKRRDGLTVVLVSDKDYPMRVAFDVVSRTMHEFDEYVRSNLISIGNPTKDNFVSQYNETLKNALAKYQDPTKADGMEKLKKDIEGTKEVLHTALEKLLDRGESIESLIERTDELSGSSKEFYKRANRSKCPCSIL